MPHRQQHFQQTRQPGRFECVADVGFDAADRKTTAIRGRPKDLGQRFQFCRVSHASARRVCLDVVQVG